MQFISLDNVRFLTQNIVATLATKELNKVIFTGPYVCTMEKFQSIFQ